MDSIKLQIVNDTATERQTGQRHNTFYMTGGDFAGMLKVVKAQKDRSWDEWNRAWTLSSAQIAALGQIYIISDNRDAIQAANRKEIEAKRAAEQRAREAQWAQERQQREVERAAQRRQWAAERAAETPTQCAERQAAQKCTTKQYEYMQALGIAIPAGCTITQASQLIDAAKTARQAASSNPNFGRHGTRYDEQCDRCHRVTEVCNECGRCERHCICGHEIVIDREIAAMMWNAEDAAMREAGFGCAH